MPGFRRTAGGWVLLAAAVLVVALARSFGPSAPPLVGRAYAVDGDTIRLEGMRVRLLGLDAPELGQTCFDASGHPWQCGEVARQFMVRMLADGEVRCARHGFDTYGRVLGDCRQGDADVAQVVVRNGLAMADGAFGEDEAAARADGAGIWAGRFMAPADWRRAQNQGSPGVLEVLRSWFR